MRSTNTMNMSIDERIESVSDRFQLVCSQLRILNRHIGEIQHRYKSAVRNSRKVFATVSGYDYV